MHISTDYLDGFSRSTPWSMDHRNWGVNNSFECCYGIWDFWGIFWEHMFFGIFFGGICWDFFLEKRTGFFGVIYPSVETETKAESPYHTLIYTLNDDGGQNIWTLTLQPELEEPDLQPKLQPELIQRTLSDSSNGTKCSRVSRLGLWGNNSLKWRVYVSKLLVCRCGCFSCGGILACLFIYICFMASACLVWLILLWKISSDFTSHIWSLFEVLTPWTNGGMGVICLECVAMCVWICVCVFVSVCVNLKKTSSDETFHSNPMQQLHPWLKLKLLI